MKKLKSIKDFQNQLGNQNLNEFVGGRMVAFMASEIPYGTYKGNGEFKDDVTYDA